MTKFISESNSNNKHLFLSLSRNLPSLTEDHRWPPRNHPNHPLRRQAGNANWKHSPIHRTVCRYVTCATWKEMLRI